VLFDDFGEVSAIAQFSYDAGMRLKGDNLVKLDDILQIAECS
jgi:hypothetical protein